jgi:hypothetical protein
MQHNLPVVAEELDNPLSVSIVSTISSLTTSTVSQAMRDGIKMEPLLSNLAPASQIQTQLCGTSSVNMNPSLCEPKLEADSDGDLGLASDLSVKSEETIKADDPEDLFLPMDMDYTETLPYIIESDTISLEHSYQQNISDTDVPLKDSSRKKTANKSGDSETGKKKVRFLPKLFCCQTVNKYYAKVLEMSIFYIYCLAVIYDFSNHT